jgi:lysophospholipase L1-like esterase
MINYELISWDFLHLNEAGYAALNGKLIDILEELGRIEAAITLRQVSET